MISPYLVVEGWAIEIQKEIVASTVKEVIIVGSKISSFFEMVNALIASKSLTKSVHRHFKQQSDH